MAKVTYDKKIIHIMPSKNEIKKAFEKALIAYMRESNIRAHKRCKKYGLYLTNINSLVDGLINKAIEQE
jgi:hypothetical protein